MNPPALCYARPRDKRGRGHWGIRQIKLQAHERIAAHHFRHRLHAIAAVTLALATILYVVTTARAQDGMIFLHAAKLPAVQVTPKKINFGKLPAGMTSNPQTVTFTNKSTVDLAAPGIVVSGTGFALAPFVCPATLLPGGSCQVSVTFMPPSKGKFKGLLTFSDGGAKSPQKVKLSGVGLAAVPTPTATATATQTATSTATTTSTATATATATSTPTRTATVTTSPKVTPSATATATATATPTVTPTATTSSTPTSSRTATPTATATGTPTRSATATPTRTATATATATPTATATATATQSASVTATPTATATAVFNVAFATSTTLDGDLLGLSGADAECAKLATAAGLPPGTYTAWLSTLTSSTVHVNAADRLGSARGFIRTDGQPFADRVADITAGRIWHALSLDEAGSDAGEAEVWTGTTNAGIAAGSPPPAPTSDCVNWTSGSMSDIGVIGLVHSGPGAWSDDALTNLPCNISLTAHLYCFDTSHISTLTVTPVSGRHAFVSKGSFDTTSGLAGADTLCQGEATAAGLANPTHFLALLSTSTASAASRFNLAGSQYVRPDGIKIADPATLAAGNALDSGIWQNADGTYLSTAAFVWTGSSTPSTAGTTATTCTNWTTNSSGVNGDLGLGNLANAAWWGSGDNDPCNIALSVYCLEN